MNKNIILAIALGILIIVAGLQAYQLFGLKEKLTDSGIKLGSATSGVSQKTGSVTPNSAPSVDELPQMVGGC